MGLRFEGLALSSYDGEAVNSQDKKFQRRKCGIGRFAAQPSAGPPGLGLIGILLHNLTDVATDCRAFGATKPPTE